jgi:hypothetical protein
MKSQFKKVFGEVDADGNLTIGREEADRWQAGMVKAVEGLTFLPFGDANYRAEYPNAVDRASKEALDGLHSGEMSVDEAADHFASRFIELMEPYRPDGVDYQESMRYVREDADGNPVVHNGKSVLDVYKIGPFLSTNLQVGHFDPDGDGVYDAADVKDNILALEEAYLDHNAYDIYGRPTKDLSEEEPLIFKGEKGRIYIAGIERDSSTEAAHFQIYDIRVDDLKSFYRPGMSDADLNRLYKSAPGLQMVMRDYPHLLLDKDGPGADEVEVFLNKLHNAPSYDGLLADIRRQRGNSLHDQRVRDAALSYADESVVQDRLAMQLYFKWRDNLVKPDDGQGAAALSKHGITVEKFRRALDQYVADPGSDCGGAKFKNAVMSVTNTDEYKMFRACEDQDYAQKFLAQEPSLFKYDAGKSFTGYDIEYYAFAGRDNPEKGSHFIVDVGDELFDYARLTPEKIQELVGNNTDREARFPGLTAVAMQYAAKHDKADTGFDNAFELADYFIGKDPNIKVFRAEARKEALARATGRDHSVPEPNPDQDQNNIPKAIPVRAPGPGPGP